MTLTELEGLYLKATEIGVLPEDRVGMAWKLVHQIPSLLARMRKLEAVVEAARKYVGDDLPYDEAECGEDMGGFWRTLAVQKDQEQNLEAALDALSEAGEGG